MKIILNLLGYQNNDYSLPSFGGHQAIHYFVTFH